MTTDIPSPEDQIIGLPEQQYCLNAAELRGFADAVEKMEAMQPERDTTIVVRVDGLDYRLTLGWDDTGTFGLLTDG